jgi:serine/threonine protein kinase/Tol biopolymer transport system component
MPVIDQLTAALTGRYDIEREIGAGGMATVFLANDVRHQRPVAVKVLNPELGAVLGVERFLAEIRVTANLQHPNLLPLFDSGEVAGLLFYVMPFVEGESLRARLEREKQLSIDEAVRIAAAVASALAYAHAHGVIHRDLKPENVLLQAGQPVIADFGIALAVSKAGGARVTQTGLSLGTPQYMSPEQAAGDRAIDGRSDIYALGCILYEMLVGDPPHTGSTVQAIIAKVLTERPANARSLRASVPVHVAFAVEKALEKLPADRWEDASHFADALQGRLMPAAERGDGAVVESEMAQRSRRPRSLSRLLMAVPWALAAVSTALTAWMVVRTPAPTSRGVVRLTFIPPKGARLSNSLGALGAISPDGRFLVYSGESPSGRQLWVRDLSQFAPRALAGSDNPRAPVFSADGKWVAYFDVVGLVYRKISLDGGTSITLFSNPEAYGVTWIRGDSLVFSHTPGVTAISRLYRMSAAGGTQIALLPADTSRASPAQLYPVAAPDGRTVFFIERTASGTTASDVIAVMSIDLPTITRTGISGTRVLGFSDGTLYYVQGDGVVMTVPFDLKRRHASGQPTPTSETVQLDGGVPKVSLSASGDLLYVAGSAAARPVFVRSGGQAIPLLNAERRFAFPRLSPDGTRIAIAISDANRTDVWIYTLASGSLERLTSEGSVNDRPEWSPDGRRVLFRSNRTGIASLWWQPVDGSGAAERVTPELDVAVQEGMISPDGRNLVYRVDSRAQARDIFMMALDGTQKPKPFLATPFDELTPRFSPDGKWIAYTSTESGRDEVYVRPFPGPGGRVIVSDSGGTEPLWSRDGRRLFYRHGDELVAVKMSVGSTLTVSGRELVLKGAYLSDRLHPMYDVTRDGDRFVMLQGGEGELQLSVVLGWARSMRAR